MPSRSVTAALAGAALLGAAAAPAAAAPIPVELVKLSSFGSGVETGAEIADLHPATKRAFVTNAAANRIDVYDLSDPAAPVARPSIDLAPYGAGPNSVSVSRDGLVAVAVEAAPKSDPGRVVFFDAAGAYVDDVVVGAQPDMLTFTPDDARVVVAGEGEPHVVDEDENEVPDVPVVDPPGTISIVIPPRGGADATATTIGFGAFDGTPIAGTHLGVPGVPFSVDVEPEYVAVSADSKTAWVSLQERNAIAKVDLGAAAITAINGLGRKQHALAANALDASDRDGTPATDRKAIAIAPRPLQGMFQPDAIAAYEAGGRTWLVTANEGDAREWPGYFVEEERVKDLDLDPAVFADPAGLQADAMLGRLNVSVLEGTGAGGYTALHSFGARSMSVLDETGAVVHDTGDGLERLIAERQPELFNAEESDPDTWDERSDSKGPEPEGVAAGEVGGRPYAFLGLERAGALVAYDLADVPGQSRLAGFAPATAADRAPEGVAFAGAADSPTGRPLVLATYEVSGTVAVFEVRGGPQPAPAPAPGGGGGGAAPEPAPPVAGPPAPPVAPPASAPSAAGPAPARLTLSRLAARGRVVRFTLSAPATVTLRVRPLGRDAGRPRSIEVGAQAGRTTVRLTRRLARSAPRLRITVVGPAGERLGRITRVPADR